MMRAGDTYRSVNQHVLTGLFKNSREVFHAQEILTDFGYPKEASSVVELKNRPQRIKAYGKQIVLQIKDKGVLGASVGAVLAVGALMAGGYFYSTLNFSEIALFLTVWVLFMILSAAACGFIGILVMLVVSSTMAEDAVGYQKAATEKSDMLISVTIRTPNDAKDIAREWVEIGGKVV